MFKAILMNLLLLTMVVQNNTFATDYSKGHLTVLDEYNDEERRNLFSQADLVLEGQFIGVKMVDKGDKAEALARDVDAYEDQLDMIYELSWLMTFKVNKAIKGEYKKDKFNVLIHSPSTQFGVNIDNPKISEGKRYRIYVKHLKACRVLIGQELIKQAIPAGCEGKYIKESNPSEYTLLNKDGTFIVEERGKKMEGLFSIEGDRITLIVGLGEAKGTYKDNYIIDNEAAKWIKKNKE